MADITTVERRQVAAECAWESILAQLREDDIRSAELRPDNHAAIFSLLAAHNITCVTICFDGYGDSGQVESVNALIGDTVAELPNCMVMLSEIARCGDSGAIVTKEHSLAAAIEDLAYDLLRQTHAGWENNDGAFGDFVLDVTERTISLDYSERYTAIESFSHQW